MPSLQSLLHLKRSKSKTPELGRPATNPVTNGHILQQTHAWPYSPQAQIQHQPPIQHQCQHMSHQQVYQPQQPIPWPHHYPSQHIIQSPQQQSIQPYTIQPQPLQSQIKPQSNLLESRPTENGMVMNGHVAHQPPHFTALQAFHSSQVQSITVTGQSQRYSTDNPYYSNQIVTLAMQQQQQQQQPQHHHQQHQHQQNQSHQQNQQQPHQHHNHNHQHNHQHQQQMLQQQQQQVHQSHQQRMVMDEPQKSRPQFQQQQIHPTIQLGSVDAQRQEQIQQQQQYQNHPIVNDTVANGNEELSLDVLWMMHESDRQKLSKLAESMEKDLKALNEELDIIRRETPTYSVSEAKI